MKSMNKYMAVAALCLPFLMISCNKNESVAYSETAVLSIQNAQMNPSVKELLPPATMSVDLRIAAEVVPDASLTVTFKVEPSLVEAYNKEHKTNYKLLSADNYEVKKMEVLLPKYNKVSSTVSILINSTKLSDEDTYILPLTIGEVKGSENWTKAETGTQTIIVVKKKILPPAVMIDKSKWKIVYCSSQREESNGGIKTGLSKDLIDGKPETYWTYNYREPDKSKKYAPFYFVFDLGQEISVRGVSLLARQKVFGNPDSDPYFCPKKIRVDLAQTLTDLEKGMNDDDYIYSESFNKLPWQMRNDVFLSEIHRVRYVRFVYNAGWNNSNMNVDYVGGAMAEFDVLGNYEDILK